MNTELRLVPNITSSNQHGKIAKDTRFTDTVKLLDMAETASGSNVQSTKSTCYRNLPWQNKAWQCSTKYIWQKSLTDHKPKRARRNDGMHVNIASFVNRFSKLSMALTDLRRHLRELDALTTEHLMTN